MKPSWGLFRYRPRHQFLAVLAGSVCSYLLISRLVVGSVVCLGTSMAPTMEPGRLYLVYKAPYLFGAPRRGDIVVFDQPGYAGFMVKRVIGVPNDSVRITPGGTLVNGAAIAEPYLSDLGRLEIWGGETVDCRVPPGHYFVLGDNRPDSEDSRAFGSVKSSRIRGCIRL